MFAVEPHIPIPQLSGVIGGIQAALPPMLLSQLPLLSGLNWGIPAAYPNIPDPLALQGR